MTCNEHIVFKVVTYFKKKIQEWSKFGWVVEDFYSMRAGKDEDPESYNEI